MGGFFTVMEGFFVDFFHFLLFFLLFVTFINYFLLLKGVRFVTFFTACNFHKLFFTIERGKGNCFIIFIHC